MPREIDDKKTRKALRKLRKARDRAQSEEGPGLTDWEQEFVEGVETRLTTFGSAFNDPEKGALDEALSARQSLIIKQIDKKARGKGMKRSGFKSKTPYRPNGRDIHDDIPDPESDAKMPKDTSVVLTCVSKTNTPSEPSPSRERTRPVLRVINGGQHTP